MLQHSDAADAMDQDSPLATRRLSTVGEVRRALNPLQKHADRVGQQVEEFAETLDRLNPFRDGSGKGADAALPLVQAYEQVARQTVHTLKRRHAGERKELIKQARRRTGSVSSALMLPSEEEDDLDTETTVKDLVHWEQEQQTWELLGLMLQVKASTQSENTSRDYVALERPAPTSIHRYSSDSAVFRNFLASDDTAWEKYVIKQWLSRVADSYHEDIYEVVEDLLDAQGETEALTSHGWIHAKEQIKNQKRLRSWNQPLDPATQELDSLFSANSQTARLITQLDPDAPTRQQRQLPAEDLAFEKAVWMGCWELIKRERPWKEVLDWCKDRAETWRALSLRPDLTLGLESGETGGDLRGRAFWQHTCLQLATNGGVNDYERAVYGLFGGDEKSVLRVCRSWNDSVFALLSCHLVQRFNDYFCQKLNISPALSSSSANASSRTSLQGLTERLIVESHSKDEPLSPFRVLQSCVMTGQVSQYLIEQGHQLSSHLRKTQYGSLGSGIDLAVTSNGNRIASSVTPENHEMIRLLAHLLLVHAALDPQLARDTAAENVLVAYVDYLGKAGKQQLLPLYASRLSKDRAAPCMARQLIYIKDPTERQTVMRLMEQLAMEWEVVLFAQLDIIMNDAPARSQYKTAFPKISILDYNHLTDLDIPVVKKGFLGGAVQDWQADLIDALEWFLLSKAKWQDTFVAGGVVYKHFLRTKSWSAASELARRISFSRIAQMKTRKFLGRDLDLSQALDNDFMADDGETTTLKDAKAAAQKDELLKSSRAFQDLESLVRALDALNEWQIIWDIGTQ